MLVFQDGVPYLGTVDKLGTAYLDKIICTGYGAYIAAPLLRDALEKNPNMSKEEARKLVEKCLEVLFYRDARSYPKYTIGIIDADEGVSVEGPLEIQQNWGVAHMIQ